LDMAYHSSVGCDRRGDQPTGYATPSACFHTPEITITPEEHDLGFTYLRSKSSRWTPFSASSYPTPPSQWTIDRYGYELGLTRLLAHRDTTDTTWTGKYNYHPLDNPWIDLQLSYSDARTEQLDRREDTAFYQLATGGKRMRTEYQDKVLELRNTSRFDTGALQHELTLGAALHKHKRDILMHMPGKTYETPRYNYGWLQPAFMPAGKQDTQSFYIQDAITYGSLTVTPSMRFDSVRNDGQANLAPIYDNPKLGHDYRAQTYSGWSPRLSVFWTATPNLAFFADYTETWRAPVIDEQYEVQNSSTIGGSSRDLDAERIHAIRGGSVINLPDLLVAGDSLQIRTTLFQNRIKDEIFRTRSVGCRQQSIDNGSIGGSCGDMLPLSNYRNLPGLTIKGFEIESFYDSQRLFGSLSYSWMTGKHDGAYSNPWGPNVWARDIPPPKWVAMLGLKVPEWDAKLGWQGEFVRKTDRLPSDRYSGGMGTGSGDIYWDHAANDSYDTHRLFAEWVPAKLGLKDTRIDFTVDNLFNRSYRQPLGGDLVYSQGRNAKISVTQFF
ncbi:heme receptor HxuC, partial [Pseudomonas aeruginosa]